MGTIKELAKTTIRDNRITVLMGILGYSIITALLAGAFQKLNLWWLGIVPMTLCVYAYMFKIHELGLKMVKNKEIKSTMFFQKPFGSKTATIVFIGYVVWAILAGLLLFVITIVPKMGIVLLALLFVMLVLGNEVSNLVMLQNNLDDGVLQAYKKAFQCAFAHKGLFGHNAMRSFIALMQGVVLVVCANVFVYGPQIQKALQLGAVESETAIRTIFSNPLSTFVQTVGIQAVILYVLYLSTIITTTYVKQKHIVKIR